MKAWSGSGGAGDTNAFIAQVESWLKGKFYDAPEELLGIKIEAVPKSEAPIKNRIATFFGNFFADAERAQSGYVRISDSKGRFNGLYQVRDGAKSGQANKESFEKSTLNPRLVEYYGVGFFDVGNPFWLINTSRALPVVGQLQQVAQGIGEVRNHKPRSGLKNIVNGSSKLGAIAAGAAIGGLPGAAIAAGAVTLASLIGWNKDRHEADFATSKLKRIAP